MKRKLLTLNNLVDYFKSQNQIIKFSANEDSGPIVVQTEGVVTFSKNSESCSEGLTPVRLQACHTDKNLNSSSISYGVMKNKMLPTFVNRPILGWIHEVDGIYHFGGHEMHLEDDNIVYDEIPVGVIPESNNATLEYDEVEKHYNVFVDGYLFDNYTKASEIVERESELAVSVEISINSMSYSPHDNTLNIEDGYFSGVTILGVNEKGEKINPGMKNSNITLKDFSQENNSIFSSISEEDKEKLLEMQSAINDMVARFTIDNTSKEGGNTEMSHFEELLEQYNVLAEDITFEYENMSDEELDAKFAELFKEDDKDGEKPSDEGEKPDDEEFAGCGKDDDEKPDCNAGCGEEDDDKEKKFSKSFELSHDDIRCALYNLLGDGWNYIVEVYEKRFIYHSEDGLFYSQQYVKNEESDSVAFSGDPVQVYNTWLTSEEKDILDAMKQNYPVIEQKLAGYEKAEIDAKKAEIFANEMYSEFIECEEFVQIRTNADNYSVDELKTQCELAFAKCVQKKGCFSFEPQKNVKHNSVAMFGDMNSNKSAKTFLDGLYALATQKM